MIIKESPVGRIRNGDFFSVKTEWCILLSAHDTVARRESRQSKPNFKIHKDQMPQIVSPEENSGFDDPWFWTHSEV